MDRVHDPLPLGLRLQPQHGSQQGLRAVDTGVDREIEYAHRERRGEVVASCLVPIVAPVDFGGLEAGQVLDVDVGVAALADAVVGLAAGVGRVEFTLCSLHGCIH